MPEAEACRLFSQTLVVSCAHGIHLRVAAKIVALAGTFQSSIWFSSRTRSANAKSILGMLELGLTEGAQVTMTARGPDAEQALGAIRALMEDRQVMCGEAATYR